jgi:uncharacterized protein (TIGR02588 family)
MVARKPARRKPASSKTSPDARRAASDTSLLEWVSAAIGLLLTLGLIGVISWEAFNADDSPAAMRVESLGATAIGSGYVLQVRVTNAGGSPAAQVSIEGELTPPGGETETAQATFDYVPDHSARTGGLFFQGDPRVGALKLRATGYAAP